MLKEKLKNIFKRDIGALQTPSFMQSPSFMQPNSGVSGEGQQQPVRLENMAENFINLINNTLTQVNTQLCNTIEAKI